MSLETRVPAPISPDRDVTLAELLPGTRVRRYADTVVRAGDVHARFRLPCHARQSVTLPVTLAWTIVVCRACSRTYRAEIIDECGGSYAAGLTVASPEEQYWLSRGTRT